MRMPTNPECECQLTPNNTPLEESSSWSRLCPLAVSSGNLSHLSGAQLSYCFLVGFFSPGLPPGGVKSYPLPPSHSRHGDGGFLCFRVCSSSCACCACSCSSFSFASVSCFACVILFIVFVVIIIFIIQIFLR